MSTAESPNAWLQGRMLVLTGTEVVAMTEAEYEEWAAPRRKAAAEKAERAEKARLAQEAKNRADWEEYW